MLSLANIRDDDIYGGKAASLGKLIRAGFNVQPGIGLAAGEKPTTNIDIFNALAETVNSLKVTMHSTWAVRSSAVGEDSSEHSFAGQHDSFLNVPAWELVQHVHKVLASAHNGRSAAYRRDRGVNGGPKMGVVIQRMVPDVTMSAVVFTKDPIAQNDDIVIEYTSGLGDKLVGGEVDPEQICVPRMRVPELMKPFDVLGVTACAIERLYDRPVDIEAAYNTQWWICQARPVTT